MGQTFLLIEDVKYKSKCNLYSCWYAVIFFFGVHSLRMTTTYSSMLKHKMKRKNPCAKEFQSEKGVHSPQPTNLTIH